MFDARLAVAPAVLSPPYDLPLAYPMHPVRYTILAALNHVLKFPRRSEFRNQAPSRPLASITRAHT
jgi:hypothetical protein